MGAKPRYPIFFTLDRNWVWGRFFRNRGEGIGSGSGLGCFVGRLFGFRGTNEADACGRVGRRAFNGAVNYNPIKSVEKCGFHIFRGLNTVE